MNISPSLIKSVHCLSLAILTSVLFAASVLTLTLTQSALSLLQLFTLNLITVLQWNCNSLYYSLPDFLTLKLTQLHRLQLIQNSLARAVIKAPKFSLVLDHHDVRTFEVRTRIRTSAPDVIGTNSDLVESTNQRPIPL